MRQVLQSLADGRTSLTDVPAPSAPRGGLLIRTSRSVISAGTERMLVDFGRAGWLEKVWQQPEKVRQVLAKVRTDGLLPTIDAVRSKLDQPIRLGCCNVGSVVEVGSDVRGFAPGDRVVSNGPHAELVAVSRNLCARVPGGVSDDEAAFTVLGAIALQGVRLAAPTLGERFVVTGLGLVGLLTVQLLRANGCRVLGIDPDPEKADVARRFGADVVALDRGEDPLAVAETFSDGLGVDGVLITAATRSNEPIAQAARMCRKRGRIVLVGVVGLELDRDDFYHKEISFQVSCSYGPGRYDPAYEEGGQDYPVGFVRWTEQRNFEAVLDLMASGKLEVEPLISHRFPLARAVEAYDLLASGEPSLGILLQYPGVAAQVPDALAQRTVALSSAPVKVGKASVAFLGAGNYAGRVLIPAFKAAGATLHTGARAGGGRAARHGRKYGFAQASTDAAMALADPAVDTEVVATRHDAHAQQLLMALQAGKHVFCEKPLCLTLEELAQIEAELALHPQLRLMIGFNRRFAPQVVRMKQLLAGATEPKMFVMTVNAGAIPPEHWTQDPAVGGGRIVGEGCHFIDLLRHLAGAPIIRHSAVAMGRHDAVAVTSDKATITLEFADGSVGTVHYFANGDKGFPKERLEVFCAGRVLQLNNFRKLRGWGWKGFRSMNLWRQNKGQAECAKAFVQVVKQGGAAPIPLDEALEVSRVSIELQNAVES